MTRGTVRRLFRAFPLPKGAGQNEVWMKETLRQRKPYLSSPEGAARLPWATLSYFIVARGCSTALLGNAFVHLRHPRVQHGTLERHFRTSSSPEGTARLSWATLSYIFVAQGCSTARLSGTFVHLRRPRVQRGALERHLRAFPPPDNSGTIPTATFCAIFVTQGFRHLFLTQVSHLRNTTLLHCLQ